MALFHRGLSGIRVSKPFCDCRGRTPSSVAAMVAPAMYNDQGTPRGKDHSHMNCGRRIANR